MSSDVRLGSGADRKKYSITKTQDASFYNKMSRNGRLRNVINEIELKDCISLVISVEANLTRIVKYQS